MAKILKVAEIPAEILNGTRRWNLLNVKIGADKLGMFLIAVKPKAVPHVPYHFHNKKESAFFVIQGKAKIIVEDREYVITPDTVVLIPPGEKHQIMNIGKTDLKIIEVYSPPLSEEDTFVVQKKK